MKTNIMTCSMIGLTMVFGSMQAFSRVVTDTGTGGGGRDVSSVQSKGIVKHTGNGGGGRDVTSVQNVESPLLDSQYLMALLFGNNKSKVK